MKYYKPQLLLKIVKLGKKVVVSKELCDGECQLFLEMSEEIRSFIQKYKCFANFLRGWFLFEILYIPPNVKTNTNVLKYRCYQKALLCRVANLFWNEGWM